MSIRRIDAAGPATAGSVVCSQPFGHPFLEAVMPTVTPREIKGIVLERQTSLPLPRVTSSWRVPAFDIVLLLEYEALL
jgi:hypothetical protein